MASQLFLGKQVNPATGALGNRLELDPADLLTHGVIVGMTGSGKTGLAIALIEEVLRQGIPVLAIDPKGDLGNLLLLFEGLSARSFAEWIDPEEARREGKTVEAAGAEAAAAWTKGLADWGLTAGDVAALKKCRDATIYTPGSSAGVPLNILQSLEAPSVPFASAEEDLRDEIAGIVSGFLGLVQIEADPLRSRDYILLAQLIETAWRSGKNLSLETLIPAIADPPFDKVGALPLESVYPRKERQGLMMALNNLIASPSFAAWRQGEPLDVGRMLRSPDNRPRLSIVATAHLSDEERLFVTALLLDKVKTWMRRQGGTSELRALVYMDEVFGYFPPHPANPPTKRPLLTLLKQARAQGLGVVLATQNPVDLDYKGLANMGIWMVGKLQTDQDRARLRDGLLDAGLDAARLESLLSATKKRVFLLHDIHRPAPCLLYSRWALSYLRGPLTRDEISRLMADRDKTAAPAPTQAATPAAAPTLSAEGPPILPPPFQHHYFKKYSGQIGHPHLLVKYAVRYKDSGETVGIRAYPLEGDTAAEIFEAEPLLFAEDQVTVEVPSGIHFAELPGFLATGGAKGIEKALKDRLPDKLAVILFVDPETKTVSQPGETAEALAARITTAGGGERKARLADQIEKKKRDLAIREQELSGRRTEKWAALGSAVLKNLGLFTGRKRTISGTETVLSKNRMQNAAEARVEALRAELQGLEVELASLTEINPDRFEKKELLPAKSDVSVLRYEIVWVY